MMTSGIRYQLEEEVGYNWEDLNKLAKQLEQRIDTILAGSGTHMQYHDIRQNLADTASLEQSRISDVENHLKRLASVIDMMSELLDQLGQTKAQGANATHLLNRHREVHQEYHRDLRKLRVQNPQLIMHLPSPIRTKFLEAESRLSCSPVSVMKLTLTSPPRITPPSSITLQNPIVSLELIKTPTTSSRLRTPLMPASSLINQQ